MAGDPSKPFKVGKYKDETHAEVIDDLQIGDYGYKYRVLDGVILPPYITPARYQLSRTIEMHPGDICFTGYPKSGSTWLSYILLLITGDGKVPTEKTLRECLHWVASSFTYPRSREYLDSLPSPRIFKSHMPFHMAVGGNPTESVCKHIYIARNPRDVVVSYYFFESSKSWAGGYDGPWEHWLKIYLDGKVQRGDWFQHVLSWWKHRDAENILFITYEDLSRNLEAEVMKLARFLGYTISPRQLETIKQKTAFEKMKEDKFSNMHEIEELGGFFRRGSVGSWKDQFTVTQHEYFEQVFQERLAGTGLEILFGE